MPADTPFGPGNPRPYLAPEGLSPQTLAVRGGQARTTFDETSEALFLTSGFVYGSAEEAEAALTDEVDKFVYSRYGNPTVSMFEERIRLLDGAEAAFATSSGASDTTTSAEDIAAGRDLAQSQGSELLIHRENGQIRARNSYGNDPYPPEG